MVLSIAGTAGVVEKTRIAMRIAGLIDLIPS